MLHQGELYNEHEDNVNFSTKYARWNGLFSKFEISLSSAINWSAILKTGFPSRLFPFSLPIILWSSTLLHKDDWGRVSIETLRNGIVARRDLGNRASPVDRVYMKRLLKVFFIQVIESLDLILSLWVKLDLQIKVNNISYCVSARTGTEIIRLTFYSENVTAKPYMSVK